MESAPLVCFLTRCTVWLLVSERLVSNYARQHSVAVETAHFSMGAYNVDDDNFVCDCEGNRVTRLLGNGINVLLRPHIFLTMARFRLNPALTPVSHVSGRQRLRSASRHRLMVPRHRHTTFGHRAFAVGGPTVWNLLLVNLRDPAISTDNFTQSLKTWLFRRCWRIVRISGVSRRCAISVYFLPFLFTYFTLD